MVASLEFLVGSWYVPDCASRSIARAFFPDCRNADRVTRWTTASSRLIPRTASPGRLKETFDFIALSSVPLETLRGETWWSPHKLTQPHLGGTGRFLVSCALNTRPIKRGARRLSLGLTEAGHSCESRLISITETDQLPSRRAHRS